MIDEEVKIGEAGNTESAAPQPKVVAATVGAGVGSAIATIVVWVVSVTTGLEVPEAVELAGGVVLTAGLAFIGGYFKKN